MSGLSREHTYIDQAGGSTTGRTITAVSWFDRARIRSRRLHLPEFRNEVKTSSQENDLEGLVEQASRDLYEPTMQAKGLHMKTVQEDLAEQAAEGGVGIGQGKHSYETPVNNLTNLDGMHLTGLGNIPLLGKLLGLIRSNPRAAQAIVTPQRIERGTFSVRVTSNTPAQYTGPYNPSTGKPRFPNQTNSPYWSQGQNATRDVDIVDVQTPGVLSAEERASIDPFTASLLKGANGAMASPQDILKLHDQLQAGQQVNLKAGPNGANWMNRVMGGVGEMLKADATRIGAINLVATLFKLGSLISAALGLVATVGFTGYSMSQINPSNDQITPMQQGYNPYSASTNNDPSSAFGQGLQEQGGAGQIPIQQPMASPMPTPYQPFGAVNQNFGNLSTPNNSNGVGAMPSVTVPQPNGQSPYGWTRVNAAISKLIFA